MTVCGKVGGGRNVQHRLVGFLRQSVYSRLAGYQDTNDAERLADDPTMRVIVGRRGGPERPAVSTNTVSRFETEVIIQDGNVEGLGRVNAKWVGRAMMRTAHRRVISCGEAAGESSDPNTTTFGIVPGVVTVLGGWWPRWRGIGESCSLGWASSSRT